MLAHGIRLVLVQQAGPVLAANAVLPQSPRRKLERVLSCSRAAYSAVYQRAEWWYARNSDVLADKNNATHVIVSDASPVPSKPAVIAKSPHAVLAVDARCNTETVTV